MIKNNYVRSILENANIKTSDDIIAQIAETVDIHYVDGEIIEHFISSDDSGRFTFCNEPIVSIRKLEQSDDLYPKPNKEIPPCMTTEDYNYYILTTESDTYMSDIDGIPISGIQHSKMDYLIKCPKIAGYRIDDKNIYEVEIVIFLDDFVIYDNSGKDYESLDITLKIRTEDAATDFSAFIESVEASLRKTLTDSLGSLGKSSIAYINSILAGTKSTLIRQVDNFNNMDSECLI